MRRLRFKRNTMRREDNPIIRLLIFGTIFSVAAAYHEDLPKLKGKVVTGIYLEEAPNQLILYEKVVPLVFEFRLRQDLWNNLQVGFFHKLKILPRLNCRSDNRSSTISTSDWLFTCPVFFYVNEFLKQFKTNYTDLHPILRGGMKQYLSPLEYQKFSHHPSLRFQDCEQVIARSWKGIYGRDLGTAEYRVLLEKCNTLPNHFEDQINDYVLDSNYLFDEMRDSFVNNFFLNTTQPDPGQVVNSLLAIQGFHLLSTFAEITRLQEAIQSCQGQKIPYSFLGGSRLESAVQDMKTKLMPLKYSLPQGLTVSKLLKLPIADCIFGPTTMVVQILLPVIRVDRIFTPMKFTYPNFLYKDHLCGVKSVEDLSRSQQPTQFLYDRSSKSLLETTCPFNDLTLCQIPETAQRLTVNKCIFEVLNASFEAIRVRDHCSFHCEKLDLEYSRKIIPNIQRVSPTRLVVAANKITPLLIKCEGKPDEMITPQAYGSIEITLPCNCYLMYHDEKFHAWPPCGNSLFVQHIIPEHMVNTTWNQESRYSLSQPMDKVNFSLFAEDDVLTLLPLDDFGDRFFPLTANQSDEEMFSYMQNDKKLLEYSERCFQGQIYLWAFILIQSILLCGALAYIILRFNTLSKQVDYGRGTVSFSVSQITNLDEENNK